jgi:hypothetical protein
MCTLLQTTKTQRGSRCIDLIFLTSALDGVGSQSHDPAALPLGKRRGTHSIGGWVVPRVGLDGYRKSRPPPKFDPRTFQAVAIRNTD